MTVTDLIRIANILQQAFCTKKLVVFLCLSLILCACGNREKEQPQTTAADDSNSVFYPINNYFRQQIRDVDTTPYYLYRVTVINGRKDSSFLSRETFNSEIKEFLLPQFETGSFRKNFTESVFEDAGTNSITLSYSPKNKNNPVQNASVLLDRDNQSVKWIFINMLSSNEDSTVVERIGWKGNQSCYLNKNITYPDNKEVQRQVSYVWNEKKEE